MTASSYARRLNGLPAPERDLTAGQRLLRSPWTWVLVAAVIGYAACLSWLWFDLTADREVEGGVVPGINAAAIRQAAWYATSTLLFWIVLFLAADRFRPQRWVVWFLALGWGASVATAASYVVNSWAATQMAVTGNFDPATSARAAVFVAPFVEEAAKATVLFWLAILARYRLVSKVSLVVLGGLSAAGFAFTENIIYYARAIVYASQTIEVGDAHAAIAELVWLRGFWTAFGHPLFTTMTAIGVGIALRTSSKVVRVLAPLVGYGLAALLHMLFNSMASIAPWEYQLLLYWSLAVPLVLGTVVFVIRQVLVQGRLIRLRLVDFVMVGWLEPTDPEVFGRVRTRLRALLVGASRGWRPFAATWRLQQAATELAFLRDAEVRGLVDVAAEVRSRELLQRIHGLREFGIADPRGLALQLPRLRRASRAVSQPGLAPGAAPLGSHGYSAVDPRWGPPQG
ncbi:MAG TPA: PrsW family intramembrane metalloprotease [Propionicimonas sp.]|nr:PrsW family intramembrane metalloprotease [Propionicimonas sp.]